MGSAIAGAAMGYNDCAYDGLILGPSYNQVTVPFQRQRAKLSNRKLIVLSVSLY